MYTVPVPETKFRQNVRARLGEAIYLLGYLIHEANWETGSLITSQRRIAQRTGFPDRTIARWMQALLEAGEITVKRVSGGSLVTIVDYQACARTRRKRLQADIAQASTARNRSSRSQPNMPPVAHEHTKSGAIIMPDPAGQHANSGEISMPQAAEERAKPGMSHILQIMNQIQRKNSSQNPDASLSFAGNQNGQGAKPGELFDYTDPHDKALAEANETLKDVPSNERARLAQLALEEMARDPRPFVRMFVRQDESGRLVPASDYGEQQMMIRMALSCKAERP